MTTVLNSTSVSNIFTTTTGSSTETSEESEQFMNILLTQLQNQNPTDPMDTETFTTQLAQFSSLEQLLAIHDAMDDSNEIATANTNSQALAYVGHSVEIDSPTSVMQGSTTDNDDGTSSYSGYAAWTVNLAADATVNIKVTDASGNVVYSAQQSGKAGDNTFLLSSSELGENAQDGQVYTMTATATDSSGDDIDTDVNGVFTVQSVDVSGTSSKKPLLQAGDLKVSSDYVKNVS